MQGKAGGTEARAGWGVGRASAPAVDLACLESKLVNLCPVGKYKHIFYRWLIMGQDPFIVWRGGLFISPTALYLVVPDESAFRLFITKRACCKT